MISVLDYKEQKQIVPSDCSLPSIRELPTEKLPDDVKEKILDYMFNNDFRHWYMLGGGGGYADTDAFTGNSMPTYSTQLNDGEYTWFDNLAMYVLRYDVKLPQSFVDHVLSFYEQNGEVAPYFDWQSIQ